jgi:nuclear pore complex protein Nup54
MFASTSNPLAGSTVKQQEPDIESRIMSIQRAWDVNSPECQFKYYFYNVVEPGTAHHYGRPANATDDAKWARAVRDNPDPDS